MRLIWENGEELVQSLEDPKHARVAITTTRRVVDGTNCYVIQGKGLVDREWGSETIISPSQGYLATSRKMTSRGKVYSSYALKGIHEVLPGHWAPSRIEDESFTVRNDGASRLSSRRRIEIVEYRPEKIPPPAAFRPDIPFGADVVDLPLGSSYFNDPWWPEIGDLLRTKFDWPQPDFSPLTTLGSLSSRMLDGQPAPPLRIGSWLNVKPMDLTSLRGKVVLIEFGSIHDFYGPRYAAALRNLYATYHPAGLEILSIHGPTEHPDEIRRSARDFRLPYPVVVDEGAPGSPGAMAEAFAIKGRICAFLIDHEGKIHLAGEPTFNGGRVVETIVSLLQKSGVRDVKPVSLETPRLPDQAFRAAETFFNTKAKEALNADPTGKIIGRIVDGDRQPIAGASIQSSLHLTFMMMTTPSGHYGIDYSGPGVPASVSSGPDGRFEIAGLCKGGYFLRASAPGRAWSQRKMYIGPKLEPASVEFVLDQGHAISGRVCDAQGKPVAFATVTPTERRLRGDREQTTIIPAGPAPTKTDNDGRFHFDGLEEGSYLIEVKAAGFKYRSLDPVPAGETNVMVTLERK